MKVILNGYLLDGSKVTGRVTIPKSVKCISAGAFEGKNIAFKSEVFKQCDKLKKIELPFGTKEMMKM